MKEHEWHAPRLLKPFLRLAPWGFPRQILMILAEGDKSLLEIQSGFIRFMHHFGYYGREETIAGYNEEVFEDSILEAMAKLIREGAVTQAGDIYGLTAIGRSRAGKMQREFQGLGRWIERFLHPQMVALVGLGVHILLAVLKLSAGFIYGSIGLISDGMDTALDGFSSILLYFGLRLNLEKVVNVILVLFMLGVGVVAGYEAVQRVFVPEVVEVNLLTFSIAILSGLVCLLLSFYQRYVAARSKQQALIAQAIDSRNHTIVAVGVIAGLVATLLQFPLLDTLVGLGIAALILKSGLELAVEMAKSLRGEEVDFSRYELDFVEEYRLFQEQNLDEWLLYILSEEELFTKTELINHCHQSLNLKDVPILRELGWDEKIELEKKILNSIERLRDRELINADDVLKVTQKGIEVLNNS